MLPLLAFSGIEFGACGSGLGGVVSGSLGFLSWVGLRGSFSIGALILRIGFWGPLYYSYNKDPPKNSIGNY